MKYPQTIWHYGGEDSLQWDLRASIAKELVLHIGIATGFQDGEDSSGRAKLGLMPSADVATRACEIAEALVSQFESREWLVAIPEGEAAITRLGAAITQAQEVKASDAVKYEWRARAAREAIEDMAVEEKPASA